MRDFGRDVAKNEIKESILLQVAVDNGVGY